MLLENKRAMRSIDRINMVCDTAFRIVSTPFRWFGSAIESSTDLLLDAVVLASTDQKAFLEMKGISKG